MRERGDSLTRSHCATIHPHPSSRPGQWVHLPACLACSDNPGFEPVASRMPTALHSRALPPCRCGWVPETGIFDRASLHCDPPAPASVSQNHRYAVPSPACSNLAREPDPSPPSVAPASHGAGLPPAPLQPGPNVTTEIRNSAPRSHSHMSSVQMPPVASGRSTGGRAQGSEAPGAARLKAGRGLCL